MKGGGKMEDEKMTLDEMKQFIIDYYVNLQRIKKASNGVENSELEYQLKVTENKLSTLGIAVKDFQIDSWWTRIETANKSVNPLLYFQRVHLVYMWKMPGSLNLPGVDLCEQCAKSIFKREPCLLYTSDAADEL